MSGRYQTGLTGEARVESYLNLRGMVCLERRFRAAGGEIDLIMLDGETVVFVEVKARPNQAAGTGLVAVTPAKQRRLVQAATAYLARRGWTNRPARFDVIELTANGVLYVPNAFLSRA